MKKFQVEYRLDDKRFMKLPMEAESLKDATMKFWTLWYYSFQPIYLQIYEIRDDVFYSG